MADYDDSFYYEEHSGAHFILTAEPTGDIDTPSFINQSAKFFKKPGMSVFKKKTLVLTDWTAEQWTEEECEEQIQYYSQLLKDEFELYAWQEPDALLKLSLNNIDLLKDKNFRKKITPVKNSHIKNLMASKKIAAKQIKYLPVTDTIQLSKIYNSQHNEPSLIQKIISEHQGIINCDFISQNHLNKRRELLAQFPELRFTQNFMGIALFDQDDIDYINYLVFSRETAEKFLTQINTLIFHKIDLNKLTFLKYLPLSCKLKTLSLEKCKNIEFLHFQNENLINLKKIDLSYTDINESNFLKFIEATPRLEILNFSNTLNLKFSPNFITKIDSNVSVHLKNFISNQNSKINCHFINNSKIENLRCSLEDYEYLSPDALSNLVTVNVTNITNEEALAYALSKATNLTNLTLLRKEVFLDLKKLPPNIFAKLKNLALWEKTFSIEQILYLLNKKPSLESLNLHTTNIKTEEWVEILKHGKNLKSLSLMFSHNLENLKPSEETSLEELENLDVSYSDIDNLGLLRILEKAKNLKSLNFDHCENIKDSNFLIEYTKNLPNRDNYTHDQ